MTLSYKKGIIYCFAFIVIIFSVVLFGCNKSDVLQVPTEEQVLMKDNFIGQKQTIGEVNLKTVKSASNSGYKGVYVITANVQGSLTKKFILIVDERNANSKKFFKFTFDSNIPANLKKEEYSNFNGGNGYIDIISLDNINNRVKVDYVNGRQVQSQSLVIKSLTVNASPKENELAIRSLAVGDPVGNCIKSALNSLSWGEMVLFVATMPESYATVLLGCVLTVIAQK